MDTQTIEAYNREAEQISLLHRNLFPERLYQLSNQFFNSGCLIDIGCGIGRDTAFFYQKGFEVIGVDASIEMLRQAKNLHQEINFIQDALPYLSSIRDEYFDNLLCSAVLMHLSDRSLSIAIKNLCRILKTEGTAIISFRGTKEKNHRENGKLYQPINLSQIINIFSSEKFNLILSESETEKVRNHLWHNLVFKKSLCLADAAPIFP
ncbi:MAG: class I SAM-dependent methyltransferase [Candidatus Competibacteraceae bacterium]|nr:MAG: class I SAM-dependent methyltransferase [Candidatus Competibacteraceae bacterium]